MENENETAGKAPAGAGAMASAAAPAAAGFQADAKAVSEGGVQASPQASPQANPQTGGLASVSQIVELADQLSACADQLHERIMRDIRAYEGRTVPESVQQTARALLDDEVVLRQRANGLYADAATYIVKSLGKSQRNVVALTTEAAEKIRKITRIGDIVGLVGGLLQLAGAAATGQAASVVGALDKIRAHMAAIEASKPPAAAGNTA